MKYDDVDAAARRIQGLVRRTPTIRVRQAPAPLADIDLWLKLECLQVTGSFKARGANNLLQTLDPSLLARGIVAASGGNHGVATARAARLAGVPATIFLPVNVAQSKVDKLRDSGAEVHIAGSVWDEAHALAVAEAQRRGAFYFHPFADLAIIAGQGTVAKEMIEDAGPMDIYLVAIGGGGLIAGMATAIRALNPSARIIGIEPKGSPTLYSCLAAGSVVTLPKVTTRVATLGCARTDAMIFDIVRSTVDEIVLVEDEALEAAARWLWRELGLAADLSGAASTAALLSGAVKVPRGKRVGGLVCGSGSEGIVPSSAGSRSSPLRHEEALL